MICSTWDRFLLVVVLWLMAMMYTALMLSAVSTV